MSERNRSVVAKGTEEHQDGQEVSRWGSWKLQAGRGVGMLLAAAGLWSAPSVLAQEEPPVKEVSLTADTMLISSGGVQKLDVAGAQERLEEAGELLDFATDGAIQVGDIHIDTAVIEPNDMHEVTGVPCYPHEQIVKIGAERASRNQHLGERVMTLLVFNDEAIAECGDAPAGVAFSMTATTGEKVPISYYNHFTSGVIVHELGHNLGLPHQQIFRCHQVMKDSDSAGEQWSYRSSTVPIQDNIRAKRWCDVPRNDDGGIDEYSSYESRMGRGPGERLTGAELHMLLPERFPIPELGTSTYPLYGTYPVSLRAGDIAGVKIPISPHHALNQMDGLPEDEQLTEIVLGVSYVDTKGASHGRGITHPHARFEVYPVAVGQHRTIVVDSLFTFAHPQRFPDDEELLPEYLSSVVQPVPVYIDEELNLVAYRQWGEDGTLFIRTEPYDPASEYLRQYQEEVQERVQWIADKVQPQQ